jgi:hypothetical protein
MSKFRLVKCVTDTFTGTADTLIYTCDLYRPIIMCFTRNKSILNFLDSLATWIRIQHALLRNKKIVHVCKNYVNIAQLLPEILRLL